MLSKFDLQIFFHMSYSQIVLSLNEHWTAFSCVSWWFEVVNSFPRNLQCKTCKNNLVTKAILKDIMIFKDIQVKNHMRVKFVANVSSILNTWGAISKFMKMKNPIDVVPVINNLSWRNIKIKSWLCSLWKILSKFL